MSHLQRACKTLGTLAMSLFLPAAVFAQAINYYAPQAGEYYPDGSPAGDQENSSVAVSTNGGFVVWQDNITDGDGLGISAIKLDATFSPVNSSFRVNSNGTNDQENPQVALLKNGGAVFVWQGGPQSFQHIYARFLNSSGTWTTPASDIQVNTATNYQITPAVAVLGNGNVIVTWASYGQDNSDGYLGVYGQILSPVGQKIGGEFQINQFTPWNQRNPAVAVFSGGSFVVTWITEQENSTISAGSGGTSSGSPSVDVYARFFSTNGTALGSEFKVNTSTNICQQPSVAVASDGSYTFVWSQMNSTNSIDGWDVVSRPFSSSGIGGTVQTVNSQLYSDQYQPKIASAGTDFMVVWSSGNEDGSDYGVYSQFLRSDGTPEGGETIVNTTTINRQWHPSVASDGVGRFLVTWSSYMGYPAGMDLCAQRFNTTLQPLSAPSTPVALALDSFTLSVTWPPVVGFSLTGYQLYVDGSSSPVVLTNNLWSDPSSYNWNPSSTHTFQLSYSLADGRVSPLSGICTNTTLGYDRNYDGLPDDWETKYYGSNTAKWPASPNVVITNGVTVLDVFLWGANPNDPTTWLRQKITSTSQGFFLNWNTIPGGIYQVLNSSSPAGPWVSYGNSRFAAGTSDSIYLGTTGQGFFKVVRNRY